MILTWDERRRQANLAKHGLDFASLTPGFFLDAKVIEARQGRFAALGRLDDGREIVVIFARLGAEGLSVISMRAASPKERQYVD